MIAEGAKIIYAGDTDPLQEVGAPGKVIALSGDAAHVQWSGGPKVGSVDLVPLHELVADRQQAKALISTHQPYFEASLEALDTPSLRVRATYDERGEDGVVNTLDEYGHLATLAGFAEMAVLTLIGQILTDDTLAPALAALEADERDLVAAKVAATLLADQLREG